MKLKVLFVLVIAFDLALSAKDIGKLYEEDTVPHFTTLYFKDEALSKKEDNYVIANAKRLFTLNNAARKAHIARDTTTTIWQNFSFNTTIKKDLVVDFSPFYQKITFYYFTEDSIIHKHIVGVQYPFASRKYLSNRFVIDLPSNSLNNYFIKYEFNNHFKIAGFVIKTYPQLLREDVTNTIIYVILFTSILLIFSLALIFYLLNKEIQYLYYGLYAFSFALYAASCLHVWHLIPHLSSLSRFTFTYYFPFSLATIFFALYILSAIGKKERKLPLNVLYGLLILKGISLLMPIFAEKKLDVLMETYLTKLDPLIFGVVIWLLIAHAIRRPQINLYWLAFGAFTMFVGQILHILRDEDNVTLIFAFMCFDILWFGIGLAINYKMTKNEKFEALNDIIRIKSNYNRQLESTVEERTLQLKEKLRVIDELNNILKINNITLSENVAHLEHARVLNKELSFDEFKVQFPDRKTCLQLLVNIKWNSEFNCVVCGNTTFFYTKKDDPYIRKCAKCNKVYSATNNTLFHNLKFPIEKAFYILFLTTSSKKYTIEAMSEMIDLRAGTIINFKKKVEEIMELKKFQKNKDMSWQDLII